MKAIQQTIWDRDLILAWRTEEEAGKNVGRNIPHEPKPQVVNWPTPMKSIRAICSRLLFRVLRDGRNRPPIIAKQTISTLLQQRVTCNWNRDEHAIRFMSKKRTASNYTVPLTNRKLYHPSSLAWLLFVISRARSNHYFSLSTSPTRRSMMHNPTMKWRICSLSLFKVINIIGKPETGRQQSWRHDKKSNDSAATIEYWVGVEIAT